MAEVTLREYTPGDWEQMYALDVVCFEPPFRFSRSTMRQFAESANAIVLLAEASGRLAGFCVSHAQDSVVYVVTLDVLPELRRTGIAARVMAEMESYARSLGAASMALHVFTGNAGAIRFYQVAGYEQIGVADAFYGRGLDAFVYTKRL